MSHEGGDERRRGKGRTREGRGGRERERGKGGIEQGKEGARGKRNRRQSFVFAFMIDSPFFINISII